MCTVMMSRSARLLLLLAVGAMELRNVHGLQAYGHAYSRPNDFSETEYVELSSRFSVFTVEKAHAAAVYGNAVSRALWQRYGHDPTSHYLPDRS
jgi:hypothetical protein